MTVDRLPNPAVLVGHSLGGFAIQRYLEDHRAPAGVLVGSPPPSGGMRLTCRMARHDPLGTLKLFMTLRAKPMFASPDDARYWYFSAEAPAKEVAEYAARLQDESFRATANTLIRPVRTKRVTTPLLVCGGSKDRTATPSDVALTALRYGVEPVILDGLPHDLMLDAGWARAASYIADWLGARLL
ncbi:alpha/beta hydrolase [Flexivirga caeni]|uniref:Alpha/beta fold hydrolase n=1 Tax=Flexivirga caeni TaxID=2294115 RepID=A0A3M9M1T3_9MICO|nr:alpha/beta fold hydrolase [Flexivirga caeni]RNI19541.1 alpha/beta fold hydrolase [Flexivirga caeni]